MYVSVLHETVGQLTRSTRTTQAAERIRELEAEGRAKDEQMQLFERELEQVEENQRRIGLESQGSVAGLEVEVRKRDKKVSVRSLCVCDRREGGGRAILFISAWHVN